MDTVWLHIRYDEVLSHMAQYGIIWILSVLKGGSAGGCTQETTWHAFCTRGLKSDNNLSSREL
jgi:hypothetical protein